MSFNTFIQSEFMHSWKHSWKTYHQQYTILANLVRDSWRTNKHASSYLIEYLKQIRVGKAEETLERTAWEKIWSYVAERTHVIETVGKLQQMLPDYKYVNFIHTYIFVLHKEDVIEVLRENGLLLRFLPDDAEFQLAAIENNEEAVRYIPQGKSLKKSELQEMLLRKSEKNKRDGGIYTNKGDKLSTIGDLHGDFEATIRVLRNMNIISVNAQKHQSNVRTMTLNTSHQLEKFKHVRGFKVEHPLPYEHLDYTAYTWIYTNNMLVQTGDLFDRGFNSREIIELFMHLDSTSGDGQVVNMAGNHEFMQYQNGLSEMHWRYPQYQIKKDSMSFGETHNWDTNRNRNLLPGSKYFKWIAQLPIVVYETKSKTMFSHGCIVEHWTDVRQINRDVRQAWREMEKHNEYVGLENIIRGRLDDPDSPLNCIENGFKPLMLSEVDGPVWNRYYNNAVTQHKTTQLTNQLQRTTESFAAHGYMVERLICAHTITNMKIIQAGNTLDNDCEFKPEQHPVGQTPSVWFIDIGMTEGYGEGKRWGGVELTTSEGSVTQVEAKHPHC